MDGVCQGARCKSSLRSTDSAGELAEVHTASSPSSASRTSWHSCGGTGLLFGVTGARLRQAASQPQPWTLVSGCTPVRKLLALLV